MQPRSEGDETKQEQLSVLVVDDDRLTSAILSEMLSPSRVTFAQSAAGGLGRLQAGGRFDAILCDIHMPGMNGMQFYEEVAKVSQQLASRIIFITGGGYSSEVADFLERTHSPCLAKPLESEPLRSSVTAAAHVTEVPLTGVEDGQQ